MLSPGARHSLYDIVRAPAGWVFDAMVACTYSADLRSILTLPAAVVADEKGAVLTEQTITPAQLARLRRTCERTLIFAQEAALLGADRLTSAVIETEGMVKAVNAPNGGAFHPKVWMVRFRLDDRISYRLAVMSRNLTADRSWDAGLILDGKRSSKKPPSNGLGTLLAALPDLCRRPLDERQSEILTDFIEAAETVQWSLPDCLSRLDLCVTGLGAAWMPPRSERLVVFSPFLDKRAIRGLAGTTDRAVAMVSRPDALDRCWSAAAAGFGRRTVLDIPMGLVEDVPSGALHAKLFAWDRGGRTGLAIGSMNATHAALSGKNVEFLAVVDATRLLPDGVQALVETGPLAGIISDYAPADDAPVDQPPPDDRPAKRLLCGLDLNLQCLPPGEEGEWRVELVCGEALTKDRATQLKGLSFRPATLPAAQAAPCLEHLVRDGRARFPTPLPLSKITGYIVFEADEVASFTLNLPVQGVTDEERRTAALRTILPNERSFMDFVHAYLGDGIGLNPAKGVGDGLDTAAWTMGAGGRGLLETLVRCAADAPERLQHLDDAIRSLGPKEFERLAPKAFKIAWAALAEDAGLPQ